MGRPGPAPKPKHVLAISGSWRADHREELGDFYEVLPEPPSFLRPRAADFFREACLHLDKMGVLAKTDKHVVVRYAVTLDRWYSAEERLAETEIHFEEKMGQRGETKAAKPTAIFAQSAVCHEQLKQLESVLGLTPADRTRLGIAAAEQGAKRSEDPMKALLNRG